MKKHVFLTIFISIIFVYILMPGDVFAAPTGTKNQTCTCIGTKYKGELNLSSDENGKNQGIEWKYSDENRPPSGFKNLSSGDRPSNNRYDSSRYPDNFDFVATGANGKVSSLMCPAQVVVAKNKIYLYGQNQVATNEPTNFYNTMTDKSDIYNCVVETEENSVVDGNSASSNTQKWEQMSSGAGEPEKIDPPEFVQKKQTCESVFGKADDSNNQSVAWFLQTIFNYIRIMGVLLAVVFSALDFSKCIISNDHEAWHKAQKRLSYRTGGVIALMLLPTLINFLLGLFISGSITDFTCGIG